MLTLLKDTWRKQRKETSLPPSIADQHIGLRLDLGDGVFLMANGDLAILLKIPGIADEALSEDELESAFFPYAKLTSLVRGIPGHNDDSSIVLQVILSQREYTQKPERSPWADGKEAQRIADEEDFLFQGRPLRRTLYLAVRWRVGRQFKKLPPKDRVEKLKTIFLREIKAKLTESGLTLNFATSHEVITYYNDVLNCADTLPTFNLATEGFSLHEEIFNPAAQGSGLGFDFPDGRRVRLYTFAELPARMALGRMGVFVDALPLKTFELTWTLSHGTRNAGAMFMLKKAFFGSGVTHLKKFNDILSFESDLSAQNPQVKMSVRLIAYNVDDACDSLIHKAASDTLFCPVIQEEEIAPHLIMTALPMNCTPESHKIVGRQRTLLLSKALAFAPVFASATDPKSKSRLWLSRRGEPVSFDPFAGGGNNHICILGNSEAGKSCLNSQLIMEFMARFPGAPVRVVDKKTSYKKLCDLFGGTLVAFNETSMREKPYSPFASDVWEEDDVASTVAFLITGILQTNPDAKISGLHTEILAVAIKLCANEQEANTARSIKSPHFTWDDIKRKLPVAAARKTGSSQDLAGSVLDDLRTWTSSFDLSGQFGFIFSAREHETDEGKKDSLMVYDLDGIADERLKILATHLAFLKISRDLARYPLNVRKLIIFEELGVLVRGDSEATAKMTTAFMQSVVKTARKIGAQAVGISNEIADFTETAGGRTFWGVSPQKIFLPQSDPSKAYLVQGALKELSRGDVSVITDLVIKKGHYSQGYFVSGVSKFKGSFLLPLSARMNALVTTSADEVALYERLRKAGRSVDESLETMEYEHPFGRGLSS